MFHLFVSPQHFLPSNDALIIAIHDRRHEWSRIYRFIRRNWTPFGFPVTSYSSIVYLFRVFYSVSFMGGGLVLFLSMQVVICILCLFGVVSCMRIGEFFCALHPIDILCSVTFDFLDELRKPVYAICKLLKTKR